MRGSRGSTNSLWPNAGVGPVQSYFEPRDSIMQWRVRISIRTNFYKESPLQIESQAKKIQSNTKNVPKNCKKRSKFLKVRKHAKTSKNVQIYQNVQKRQKRPKIFSVAAAAARLPPPCCAATAGAAAAPRQPPPRPPPWCRCGDHPNSSCNLP